MIQVLLIGGGHAHLSILRSIIKEEKSKKYHITMISPSRYQYYSGMFSGFTEGIYSEEDIRIDIEDLCKIASVTFIKDTVLSIDSESATLT
ncbi:hypothetical protein [Metabacillus indicus]|uniref:hypothetical protein n=1 Tax=Metabacillus indicus TaxID=246786 RepID=UPI003CF5A0B1